LVFDLAATYVYYAKSLWTFIIIPSQASLLKLLVFNPCICTILEVMRWKLEYQIM
jgi:hypothetical protein